MVIKNIYWYVSFKFVRNFCVGILCPLIKLSAVVISKQRWALMTHEIKTVKLDCIFLVSQLVETKSVFRTIFCAHASVAKG